MFLFRLLIIPLFGLSILFTSAQIASAQSPSQAITPSFYPLAPCPTCINPEASPGVSVTSVPISGSINPTNGTTSPQPTDDPCQTEESSLAHDGKSKHWKHNGDVSGFMEALLRFFLELINLLLKLFGGGQIPLPDPSDPSPSTQPEPSTNPQPTAEQPEPTANPCNQVPTSIPSTTAIPSISSTVPSSAPSTTIPSVPATNSQIPAQVLNLANWKLQLPIGAAESPTEIKQPALATYKIDPWFITQNGGVRFRAAVNGVTTSGSNYPRSELREMTTNGTVNAAWNPASGTHTMTIDEAITAVPTTKKHVVAGQIHDGSDDVIVIRLEQPKLFIDIGGNDGPTLDANYTLGKRFTVKFEVSNNQTKIYYNGSTTPAHTMSNNYTSAYFKAGAYTQSNCTTETAGPCSADNYGEVIIYSVAVTHQ